MHLTPHWTLPRYDFNSTAQGPPNSLSTHTIIFLKEELKTEVQLGKFENQIDYLEQFMNWVASPLANRKKL